jgi:hypothetical protein
MGDSIVPQNTATHLLEQPTGPLRGSRRCHVAVIDVSRSIEPVLFDFPPERRPTDIQ